MALPPEHGADIEGTAAEDAARFRRWRLVWFGSMGFLALVIVGTIAAAVAATPKAGHHRHVTSGVIAIAVVLVVVALIAVGGWHFFSRNQTWVQLQRYPWRLRRRTMIDLRKGRPIAPENRDVAQALINFHRGRWFLGLWLILGACWGLITIFAHGNRRWFDLGLALVYLGLIPFWLRIRRQILNRQSDVLAAGPAPSPGGLDTPS